MCGRKAIGIAAAIFALFVFSFSCPYAFAEEATYSDTTAFPTRQKRQVPAPEDRQDINQESISTSNAILSAPAGTLVEDEKPDNYIVRSVQVAGNNTVPSSAILKKVLTHGGLPLNEDTVQIDAQAISAAPMPR